MSEGDHTGVHAYAFKNKKKLCMGYFEEVYVLLEYVWYGTVHKKEKSDGSTLSRIWLLGFDGEGNQINLILVFLHW